MRNTMRYFQVGRNEVLPDFIQKRVFPTNLVLFFLLFGVALPLTVISYFYLGWLIVWPILGVFFSILSYACNVFLEKGIYASRLMAGTLPMVLASIFNAFLSKSDGEPLPSMLFCEGIFLFIPFILFDLREVRALAATSVANFILLITFPIQNNLLESQINSSVMRIGWIAYFVIVLMGITSIGLILGLVWLNKKETEENNALANEVEAKNRKIEEEVKAKLELEVEQKIHEARTNTFVNLAHETKTPLTLLNHYLEKHIEKNGLTDDLRLIKKSTEKLTRDIVNFFDLEKIQRGIYLYNHHQSTDLTQLSSEIVALFRPFAEKKQLSISTNFSKQILVAADPEALVRVLNNLIENAIRYTPSGGKIAIELLETEHNTVQFCIRDTGIGIPANMQASVFEPYIQINSQKKNNQGMGLGLSIVKKIVEQIPGTIQLRSIPEEHSGTSITISLPAAQLQHLSSYTLPSEAYVDMEVLGIADRPIDPARFSVLVVEDNIGLLNLLVGALQDQYNVYYATSGNKAIALLKDGTKPDLIISDIMMDDGDGFDLYEKVHAQRSLAFIPFIFLTAKTEISERLTGLSMGAVDYINKPFQIEEIKLKIDTLLNTLYQSTEALLHEAYTNIRSKRRIEHYSDQIEPISYKEKVQKFQLSPREQEIVSYIIQGKTSKEIGELLFISEHTVSKHIQNIFQKTATTSRMELSNLLR